MTKEELQNSYWFRKAPPNASICYVLVNGFVCSLGECMYDRKKILLVWDANVSAITKKRLLKNREFRNAIKSSEILIHFIKYNRLTSICNVEYHDNTIYIRELT